MAQDDEILTRYTVDVTQAEKNVTKIGNTLREAGEQGSDAFSKIGVSSEAAGKKIVSSFGPAEKTIASVKTQITTLKSLIETATDPAKIARFTSELNAATSELKRMAPVLQGSRSQFNALGSSINQLSRELPAFTMNLNTGFLAISNNLPMLFDSINQLKAQNADLAAQGKQTQSVLGAVAGAVFSWQTALSIGITLLTAYGGKIFDFIAGNKEAKKSEEELRKEQEKHNDEMMRGVKILNELNVARGKEVTGLQKNRSARAGGLEIQRHELDLMVARGAKAEEIFNKEQSIRENEKIDLKERLAALELYGDDRLETQLLIDAKEREIELAKTKFEAEQAKEAQKIADKRAELNRLANEAFLKSQEETRQQAGAELQKFADDYIAAQDKEKKAEEDTLKAKGELWLEEVRLWGISRANKKAILEDELKFSGTTYARQNEILKQLREENLISEYEYAEAIRQLEYKKKMAALDTISTVSSALGSFVQILGANTEAGKALAIAQTTIDTYVAAQKAYLSQMQFDPTAPIRATIAAAAAVAAGLARVASIASVTVPKPQGRKQIKSDSPFEAAATFRTGVVDINGPGSGTSDDIPAWISRGESVITAKSTSAKRDDLLALNKGVPDYEALLYKKYVKPAIDHEAERQYTFAANVAKAIAVTAFNDSRIVDAIKKNRPATGKDIQDLTAAIAKRDRTSKFESNLKQPKNGR